MGEPRKGPVWLTHLRTDRRGLPVPYVNAWGLQDPARIRIGFDHHARRPGLFEDDDDHDGGPDFTRQNMQRQRECVLAGLCQVCARPVPWSRRRLVIAALSVQTIHLQGRAVPVVTEPWLCPRCAQFAVATCPALIRRSRGEQLVVVEVASATAVRIVLSTGWVEGSPCAAESLHTQPVMWAKIALLEVQVLGPPPREGGRDG